MTWNDITCKKYVMMQSLFNDSSISQEDRIAELVSIVYGDVYIHNLADRIGELTVLLKSEVKRNDLEPEYVLNGTTYYVHTNPQLFTLAQATDYFNIITLGDPMEHLIDLLSIVLIPTGHEYNNGYDIEVAKRDVELLPITDALAIFFYFKILLKRSLNVIRKSLMKQMKKSKVSQELKDQITQMNQLELNLLSGDSYR